MASGGQRAEVPRTAPERADNSAADVNQQSEELGEGDAGGDGIMLSKLGTDEGGDGFQLGGVEVPPRHRPPWVAQQQADEVGIPGQAGLEGGEVAHGGSGTRPASLGQE